MIIALVASLGYVFSVVFLYWDKHVSNRLFIMMMGVAFIAHLIQVTHDLSNIISYVSAISMLTLVAFCMSVLGAIRYFISNDKITYTIIALVSAICVWLSAFFSTPVTKIDGWGLKIHIIFSIAAYITLGFAALYACFLLIKDQSLRKEKYLLNVDLPLSYIERTMMVFTIFGEILLSLSLVTGIIFIENIWAQHIFHKILFSVVSWIIIAIVLARHYRQGFRGKQAAWWLLLGFFCLVLSYFGIAFIMQVIL